jgi:glucuronokinase
MIITTHAFARAGLVGNPSDGYYGKTISFTIRNFKTTVHLWESPHFEVVASHGDLAKFDTVDSFLRDVRLNGYYGGMRLIKAAVKRFHEWCEKAGKELHRRNFTIEFETDIPRLVGMSGSSAIVAATMRALMQFYDVEIDKPYLPTLILSVEKDELGISAGLQDRVIQVYEGIVHMDFERSLLEARGYGNYVDLHPPTLPPLYVAYDPERAEVSDVPHRNLRALYNSGDAKVVDAMHRYRALTDKGRGALMSGDWDTLHQRRVEVARSVGVSAKFAGSGGAILGLYRTGRQYQELVDALAAIRCTVLRPLIFPA